MGFFIMILFIVYLLACVGIYGYVCKKTANKKIRILIVVLLVLIGFGDNIIQLTTFYYLCHTQGGQKIYRTIDNAEGFLDEWSKYGYINEYQDLVEKKYEFIEVEVKRDPEEKLLFPEDKQSVRLPNGKYRYYLAKAGSPHCEYFYKYHSKDEYHKNFPKGYCLSIEKVDVLRSRYAYSPCPIDKSLFPILYIRKTTTKIWEIKTGEILGTATSFSYYGSWVLYIMQGLQSSVECPKHEVLSLHGALLYQVLKPNKNKEVMK